MIDICYKESNSPALQKLWNKMWDNRNKTLSVTPENIISTVYNQKKSVAFVPSNFFESVRVTSGYCDLLPMEEIFNPVPVSIAVRKGAPYLRRFNEM